MMAQAPNAYQLEHLEHYDGTPQRAVHPAPLNIQRPSSHTPAAQRADVVAEMRAVDLLHDNFAANRPTVQDTMQAKLHQRYTMAQILRLAPL